MKRTTILLSSLLALTATSAHGQTTGGGAQGTAGANQNATGQNNTGQNTPGQNTSGQNTPGTTPGAGLNQNIQGATPPGQLPPGVQNRGQVRSALPPRFGTNGLASSTNSFGTNGFVFSTNGFGTNAFAANTNFSGTNGFLAGTNQFGLSPTSQTGGVSRVLASNSVIRQDVAFSAADRQLLAQVRQNVSSQIANLGRLLTVRYIVRDGVVRIVGFVRTMEESQRIASIVQTVPGVLRVENQLQVSTGINPATGVSLTNTFVTNQPGVGATLNNQFGTNLAPTSRPQAPSRILGTNAPPGSQRRLDLPAGPQGQTNFSPSGNP